MSIETIKAQVGNREIVIETGRMAKQAHGSVTVQCGGTVILATVVAAREADEKKDFFPLMVDYRERTYAAGRIPGGYFKREGRPTEKEILTSRLIDRPLRPLFPEDYRKETQIMVTVLSVDGENTADMLAMTGASAALLISDIPFDNPLGAVRIALLDGAFVVNPAVNDIERSDLDLVVAATRDRVVMLEGGAKEISEAKVLEAIDLAHQEIRKLIAFQQELRSKVGRKKQEVVKIEIPEEISKRLREMTDGQLERIYLLPHKEDREEETRQLYKKISKELQTAFPDFKEGYLKMFFERLENEKLREYVLEKGKRLDSRGFKDIRPITCEIGVLPRTHGSALFTRGQTQSLSVATLGTGDDEQRIDSLEGEVSKAFMLHYNFPPFSVGEVGPNRGPGRREIGHGALAERALFAVIPSQEEFPYTVRLVSDILESNGSSSMATVCGGTLALMDAGVPIKAPVAGVALGLVTKGARWQVLSDIAGSEDHHGDMDFKVAGTRKGVTAIQMDLKISGVTGEMLKQAFQQALEGRLYILDIIQGTISTPKELSAYAPRITTLHINPEKIGALIGPGGKNIKKIVEETGAKIDIEDDGRVFVSSIDSGSSEEAIRRIQAVCAEAEIGKIYQGKVRKLMNFGAFCEILPGLDGLCHVSEVSEGYVKNVADYLRVGDEVPVKVVGIDDNGKISLSIKQAKEGGWPMLPPDAERDVVSESAPRGRDRGGRERSRR